MCQTWLLLLRLARSKAQQQWRVVGDSHVWRETVVLVHKAGVVLLAVGDALVRRLPAAAAAVPPLHAAAVQSPRDA